MINKQCKTCGETKNTSEFFKGKGNVGGLVPNCKDCMKSKINKKATNKASKKYRDNNLEKRSEYNKSYFRKNKESRMKHHLVYLKDRYKNDPIYRMQSILRQQIVDYLKYKKNDRTSQLLGYTIEDFISTHGVGGENKQLDHKIPQSWFKPDTPIHIVWDLDNLQWLDAMDNLAKSNRFAHPVSERYLQLIIPYIETIYIHDIRRTE